MARGQQQETRSCARSCAHLKMSEEATSKPKPHTVAEHFTRFASRAVSGSSHWVSRQFIAGCLKDFYGRTACQKTQQNTTTVLHPQIPDLNSIACTDKLIHGTLSMPSARFRFQGPMPPLTSCKCQVYTRDVLITTT